MSAMTLNIGIDLKAHWLIVRAIRLLKLYHSNEEVKEILLNVFEANR